MNDSNTRDQIYPGRYSTYLAYSFLRLAVESDAIGGVSKQNNF